MSFVRSYQPNWIYRDLQGLPLTDSDYIFFLSNTFPYLPQLVFQDPSGTIPWSTPIEFLANGQLPDNIYFNPALVYRIEIRAGNSQADPLLYLIENYVPSEAGGPSPTPVTIANAVTNQITNPQFFDINFSSPLHITAAGTYSVAPGWDLVLTSGGGSPTADISQVITNINQAQPNNPVPAYALELKLNGWSSAILQQTLNNLGNIWNNQYLDMSVLAFANDGVARTLTLSYKSGVNVFPIVIGMTNPTVFTKIEGQVFLTAPFTGATSNFGSSVQLQIQLSPTSDTIISNVQALPEAMPINVPFEQETLERQEDHLFHYYENSILIQPKDNLLCGWNFPLNPSQFAALNNSVIAAQCDYLIDQTILYQQTAGSHVKANDTDAGNNFDLVISANNAANQFALIQYIAAQTIQPYWSQSLKQNLSSLVRIYHKGSTPVKFKMRLIWRISAIPTISATEPISAWTSGGDPSFQTGWNVIKPLNDPTYTTSTVLQSFDFNQFTLPTAATSNGPVFLGIVIYTISDMQNPGGSVVFDRISLVPNDFAIDCNTRTFDEELRKCQYYYETSYDVGSVPGIAATGIGSIVADNQKAFYLGGAGGQHWRLFPWTVGLQFNTLKNNTPNISFYSDTTATKGRATAYFQFAGNNYGVTEIIFGGFYTPTQTSTKTVKFVVNTANPLVSDAVVTGASTANAVVQGALNYQYVADSRLGR